MQQPNLQMRAGPIRLLLAMCRHYMKFLMNLGVPSKFLNYTKIHPIMLWALLLFKVASPAWQIHVFDCTSHSLRTFPLSPKDAFDVPTLILFALRSRQYGSLDTARHYLDLGSDTLPF